MGAAPADDPHRGTDASPQPKRPGVAKRTLTPRNFFRTVGNVMASGPVLLSALVRPKTSHALREKVMLGVTSVTDCRYCQWGHTYWAMAHGVPLEEVNQILGHQMEALEARNPAEAAAILFAQHYAENLDRFDPEAIENLREHYSDIQVAEILAYVRAVTLGNLTGNTVDAFLGRLRGDGSRDGGSPDFSLFTGGPLYRLLFGVQRSQGGEMRQPVIIVGVALLAWLPLLVLSAVGGQVSNGSVAIPFLQDLEVHVRLLVAMPLLIIAALVTEARARAVPQQFMERNLVPENAVARFEGAIGSAIRLRDSVLAEALLIAFVYGAGILIWRRYVAADTATWYATPSVEGSRLTLAGTWYAWVSLPFFQFLLCRWYFRLFIWARFLWQVSRIELKLVPTHPDRLAGLGFLSNSVQALAVFAAAHGTLLAGYLATRIVILGAPLTQFKAEIAIMVVLVLCMALGPLLVFVPQLAAARRTGLRKYGGLAMRYVSEFEAKWLRTSAAKAETLVGSADIQSLADMGNSYDIIRKMRTTPITMDAVQRLTAATLAPIVPLLITMMPMEELVRKLAAILF
jgi:AhpD family alkylhydroperoxidase